MRHSMIFNRARMEFLHTIIASLAWHKDISTAALVKACSSLYLLFALSATERVLYAVPIS